MTGFKLPGHIESILHHLTENGHAAYVVGGCVRDSVIGRPVHDWDVATSASPEKVAGLFRKTVLTGEKFGTVTVIVPEGTVEVTTFRVEGAYNDGRRPGSVEFVSSIEEDLSRRDFTINAMALSVSGQLCDPYGGLADIESRVLRCVGEADVRFQEDALRMFRAYRFSAELGFAIEPETKRSICSNAEMAKRISGERIRDELERTLLSNKTEIVCGMIASGLLDRYITQSGKIRHDPGRIALLPEEAVLRWCAFCAMLMDGGVISSAGRFLRDLRLDGKTIKTCSAAVSIQSFPDDRAGIKRLLAKYGTDAVRCAAASLDTLCDISSLETGGRLLEKVGEIVCSGECFSLESLSVSGSDIVSLGFSPGREIGVMLDKLLDHVIGFPEDNTREVLVKMAAECGSHTGLEAKTQDSVDETG